MLPLRPGYYVADDTPCEQASAATVMRVHRRGINSSRLACEFRTIEQIGPGTFRTTESCKDIQDDAPAAVAMAIYAVPDDTRFTAEYGQGWRNSARYCPQSRMPPGWRDSILGD